jgi:PKD repeat protein
MALAGALALAGCTDRDPVAAGPESVLPTGADQLQGLANKRGGKHVAGRVIVRLRANASASGVASRGRGSVKRRLMLDRTYLLEVPRGQEEETAARLAQDPDVEWAEPDYMIELVPCEVGTCQEGNDSFRGYRWDLHNPGFLLVSGSILAQTGKADADIDWQEMYDYLGPSYAGSAVIGIIDSGVRATHQDLAGKVIGQRNLVTTDPAQVGNAVDDNGHGTHVAGIAAARGNNGLGVMGVGYGPNIKILAGKACNAAGSCPTTASAEGIIWAVDNGANVINLSLGGFGSATVGSSLQRAALQYAAAHNVLVVCATGNDARNPAYTGGIAFPSRFPECMAVGATDWSDGWAGYSNFGPGISVSAPGGDSNSPAGSLAMILSPTLSTTNPASNATYGWKNGTSMAAPQVSGLAAVLYSLGITDRAAIRARIEQTVDDLGEPGWDEKFGWGRINAYRAVTLHDPNAPPVVETGGSYSAAEGSAIHFDGSASYDPNGKPVTFAWDFGDGSTSTAASPTHVYADDGAYTVTLVVTDPSGRSSTGTTVAAVANAAPVVSASLSGASVASGGSVSLSGSFSDAGVNDSPWGWVIDWGNGTTSGSAAAQSEAVTGTRRFCAAGTYTVRLSVTDKDGGTGSSAGTLSVGAIPVSIRTDDVINRNSGGKVKVVILSTATFDARALNPASLSLGGGSGPDARVIRKNNGQLRADLDDVNGDGREDLEVVFENRDVVASGAPDNGLLVLRGTMSDGCSEVRGQQAVRVKH